MGVPIFVISRDRLDSLVQLLVCLAPYLDDVTIIDNASTYPPLLDSFEAEGDIKIVRSKDNLGHHAPWLMDLVPRKGNYVVTDPDVVLAEDCPIDFMMQLEESLAVVPDAIKVGLGLKIDDLPDHYKYKDAVIKWEGQFWQRGSVKGPKNVSLYKAPVDTTFAMYRHPVPDLYPAYRTGAPYLIRHLPWYSDSENPTEEEVYYKDHASAKHASWVYDDIFDQALKANLGVE